MSAVVIQLVLVFDQVTSGLGCQATTMSAMYAPGSSAEQGTSCPVFNSGRDVAFCFLSQCAF